MPIPVSTVPNPFQAVGNVEAFRPVRTPAASGAEPAAARRSPVVQRPETEPEPVPEDVVVSLARRDPTAVLLFSPGSRLAASDGTVLLPTVDLTPRDVVHIVSRRVYRTNLEALRQADDRRPPEVDRLV